MKSMKMSNRHYDTSKWVVLIFLPAFAVLVAGIGELYGGIMSRKWTLGVPSRKWTHDSKKS